MVETTVEAGTRKRRGQRLDQVAIVGSSMSSFIPHHDLKLDELVFTASYQALKQAGMRKQDIELTMLSSFDLYDARTISNGVTSPGAAGYLGHELRTESDALTAVKLAALAVRARQAEAALVVAIFNPEVVAETELDLHMFTEQISSYTFDPHLNRPVGVSASALLAMHAAASIDAGETSREEIAEHAAMEINRGVNKRMSSRRAQVSAQDVMDSSLLAWPLTELMLPANTAGVVAFVLTSQSRAARCPDPLGRIVGWGSSTSAGISTGQWLSDPAANTARAAATAYEMAGIAPVDLDLVEMTALTPALHEPILRALGLHGVGGVSVNPSGGVRSCFPGVANGAVRLAAALDEMAAVRVDGTVRGMAHGVDNIAGPVSSTATVIVLEQG